MIKLSVIIPAYNCEKYIETAIMSVINESERGIQIIVVDDGSTDNTLNICKELEKKYSSVKVYSQNNSGPGEARNLGIKKANGKYITFLDSDDYILKGTFKKVFKILEQSDIDIFIGNILCFNDVRKWHLPYMSKLFGKNKELVLGKFNELSQVVYSPSVCNKWFKRELVINNNIEFDTDINVGEDLLFTQKALLASNNIGYKDIDIYEYRLVKKDSLIKKSSVEFFEQLYILQNKIIEIYTNRDVNGDKILFRQLEFLVDSFFIKIENISSYEIEKVIDIAINIFQLRNDIEFNIEDFRDLERFILAKLLKDKKSYLALKFCKEVILKSPSKAMIIKEEKHYSYLLKWFPEYKEILEINPSIENKVENSYIENSRVIIRGYSFVRGIDIKDISNIKRKVVIKGKYTGKIVSKIIENDYRTDLTYIFRNDGVNYDWGGYKPIIIELNNLDDDEYEIFQEIEIGENKYIARFEYRLAEIKNKLKVFYLNKNKEIFCNFEGSKYLGIRIRELSNKQLRKSKLRKLRREHKYNESLIRNKKYKSFIVLYLYRIFGWYFKKKDIWLMGERPDTAQDNTYHLYKFIKENNKNINANYVIKKGAKDVEEIKQYGGIVWFNSILHSMYLLTCKYTINSYVERPNMYTEEYLDIIKYYPEYKRNKKVFLQHGVIGVSRVNHVLHKNKVDYDLFVVSSEFEKKHILEEFGYKDEEVVITGLARWDNLNNNAAKNKILLMPTWRSWIKSEEELINSEYFKRYIELITSEELHKVLEEKNYELTFYPHYQTQKLIEKMDIKVPDYIKFVKQGEKKVQELINENYLLITDYSSVSYDFAYCNKPVIFYQFDYDEFFSNHYNKGPVKKMFGIVNKELKDIIVEVKNLEYLDVDREQIKVYIEGRHNNKDNIIEHVYKL